MNDDRFADYRRGIETGTMKSATPNVVRDCIEEIERVLAQRDALVKMLAYWCVSISRNGTGWDDWDEAYKNAAYPNRQTDPPELRKILDEAIKAADEAWGFF